ncbi:MAG TPA: hypothetical protein PKN96_03910 [Flavobacterium sp.]|uniref:hypothetical protein n=1 Tax=Flavobacterium sp. TaxID=239 RepID=UPI002C5F6080|nr:hypothetical protein [Flavobacterium sp.]HNP32411.1 hypothetical protein [Flavobacterium sp.]
MEPNKLENQIREKLNSREIQPSAQAWDRLDAMLSVAEEKKTRRSFGWLYIAASVLVLVTLGMFFFSQKNAKSEPQNNVAETEIENDTIKKDTNQFHAPILEKVQENKAVASTGNQLEPESNRAELNPKSQKINNNQSAVSINNQKPTIKNQSINQNPLINRDKQIEFQNSSDVALKDLPKVITPKEVTQPVKSASDESLLADLDKTAKQSANQKSSVKIDAKSLLSQVDGELEQTFREKVINKISKNYKEVKVALANRNNE